MNIIIDPDQLDQYKQKYTVLELDTIRLIPSGQEIKAYCVVENIPIVEMPDVDSKVKLHENLIIEYKKRNWNFCEQAIEHLMGRWGHELDSFYQDVLNRVDKYKQQEPEETWDGVIEKNTDS